MFDNSSISGKVLNDNNEPVQLASLIAKKGPVTQQTNSDGSGNYFFNLSSGQWTISVSKNGFISPNSKDYNLLPGDNINNQNLQLIPRANQVNGSVYKLVTNSQGQTTTVPFVGATVTASPGAGQPVASVSNSLGQYSLNLKNGSFLITTSESGYSAGNPVQLTLDIAQTISGVDFTLSPNPCSVAGFVTDPNGQPIEGATLSVQDAGTVNSLSSGSYSLTLPSGSFSLNAVKQGFVSPQPVILNLNSGQSLSGINFQLVPNAGIVSGKVLNEGQPINGALVTAVKGNSSVSTNSNQSGDFTLNLLQGQWNIHVSKSGFLNSSDLSITIGPGQTSQNNNFNLIQNSASITGLVNSGFNLINNADVSITEVNNPQNILNSITDINGKFSLSVEAGKNYNISITKSGYGSKSIVSGILSPLSTTNFNFDITSNPSSFSGKVLNNLQLPVYEAKVLLINNQNNNVLDSTLTDANGNYSLGVSEGTFKIVAVKPGHISDNVILKINIGENLTSINFTLTENYAMLNGTVIDNNGAATNNVLINFLHKVEARSATTSLSGDYIFSKLLGDIYNISISKSGYSDTLISNYKILDGESKSLNITLKKFLGRITGNVIDNNKIPVPQANISAKDKLSNNFSAITDNNGNYLISSLDLGDFIVSATKSGFTSLQQATATITLVKPEAVVNINDFSLNTGSLSGIVKDNFGNPLSQAQINISGAVGSASSVSGNDGKFSISSMATGNYNLSCKKDGYSTFRDTGINVTDNVSHQIILNLNNTTIKGYVKNRYNNNSLSIVIPVSAVSDQLNNYQTTTDLNGYFEFKNVGSNSTYKITTQLFKEGIINDTIIVNVPALQSEVGPETLFVKVNNSFVNGNVGTTSAGIKLINLSTKETNNVSSSSTGSYQFGYIPNGSYSIVPEKSGFVFLPVSKEITLGAFDSLSVNFQSSSDVGNILVTTLDNMNNPTTGVTIAAINYSSNLFSSGTSDNSGNYKFTDLPSGTYSLKIFKDGYSPDSALAIVKNGVTINQSFIIRKNSASVSGLVNQTDANIVLRNLVSGQSFNSKNLSDGTYLIANLDSGSYQVNASKVGFTTDSTAIFHLNIGENKTLSPLKLNASFVRLIGKVVYKNAGKPNVIVNAISSSVLTDTSDINGDYAFENAQIKPLPNDTTIYQIKIIQSGISTQSKIISIPGTSVGK